MSCINPIDYSVVNRFNKRIMIKLDCNHCINCMIKKESQIEFLAKKELLTRYMRGESASFITLTYDDSHLPINNNGFVTLKRSDVQKFFKRMRRNMEYHNRKIDFKYLYCGEYGDGTHSKGGISTRRPHYHIVLFGLSPKEARFYTRNLWSFGLCDVGCLSAGGIRYLCKYMTKACPDKDVKEFRKVADVQNPFFYHSIGIGKDWINKNLQKIVEDGFTFNLNGKINLFPKYVLRYVAAKTGVSYIPYVRKFMKKDIKKAKMKNISFTEYDYERSLLRYKTMIENLRQQGKPIKDIVNDKHYVKPTHYLDRKPDVTKLADLALYGDVVPF